MKSFLKLLSEALVAFTIEFDNEFEHRMPHRTTNHGGSQGPWLVSMAMYLNCMRFVEEEAITAEELERLACTRTNLNGMHRWGYVTVESGIIRPTKKGIQAKAVWQPLFSEIEQRWKARFGKQELEELSGALQTLIGQLNLALPDCLPILGYGLFSRTSSSTATREASANSLPLASLLAKPLLAFALEFERQSELSLQSRQMYCACSMTVVFE